MQIDLRLDAKVLARAHNAVQDRRCPTPGGPAAELPVATTQGYLPQRLLGQVNANRQIPLLTVGISVALLDSA